jgi:hypothetical protein
MKTMGISSVISCVHQDYKYFTGFKVDEKIVRELLTNMGLKTDKKEFHITTSFGRNRGKFLRTYKINSHEFTTKNMYISGDGDLACIHVVPEGEPEWLDSSKHYHITLWARGKWKPKDSNTLLESILGKN